MKPLQQTVSPTPAMRPQRGASLLEVLIALLIFSFGVLGIVGLQANMNIRSTEAKQRAEAAVLADEIIGRMWVAQAVQREDFAYRADAQCNAANPEHPGPPDLLDEQAAGDHPRRPGQHQPRRSHRRDRVDRVLATPADQRMEQPCRPRPHQFEQLTPRGGCSRGRGSASPRHGPAHAASA